MDMRSRIGFMQGRLSPLVDGKIQAFPKDHWREEFATAEELNISCMEWTLDHDGLFTNPFLTKNGQAEIKELCAKHNLSIPSLTGDFFMQAPFYKAQGLERNKLMDEMKAVLEACAILGVTYTCIPLVDAGRIENEAQEQSLLDGLEEITPFLEAQKQYIVFESDASPAEYKKFLEKLPSKTFGVNLDTGNSAAFGIDITDEITHYGERVLNVHIKDRVLGGTTLPLGTGDATLPESVAALEKIGYTGNYILQTARAEDGNHAKAINTYTEMTLEWIKKSHA
ncbi:MAG: sugar phosphate isomerase/epimerase family protein [Desulfovibrio sp.]